MHLEVPYFSQIDDVSDSSWKGRACTITNLKMIMEFYTSVLQNTSIEIPSIDGLIKEGVTIGAYDDKTGWIHEGVVRLARNHGLLAYRQEFLSNDNKFSDELTETGIKKIAHTIENGSPVIVSVDKGFGDNKTTHTITLIGTERSNTDVLKSLHYHDPFTHNGDVGKDRMVDMVQFKKFWRKLAIFIGKSGV